MRSAVIPLTIAAGESQTAALDITPFEIMQLQMPTDWTAANITVLTCSTKDGTFQPLYDDAGNEVTIQSAASRNISLDINMLKLASASWIKFRSGTAGTPVNQAAAREIKLIGKWS